MECPPRLIAIAQALWARHPPRTQTDDQSRLFIRLVAEQAAFELGRAYGLKAAGPGRPQGPSQIAYTGEAIFGGWRLIDTDGSQSGTVGGIVPHPPWQELRDQLFLPVDPIDHLQVGSATPLPTPTDDLARLTARVDQLERVLRPIAEGWPTVMADLERLDVRIDQRYLTKMFGLTIVSTPEKR